LGAADLVQKLWVEGAISLEVSLRLAQAQFTVWATSDLVGIMFILAIIVPKAHGTNLVGTSPTECFEPAAWTPVGRHGFLGCPNILEGFGQLVRHGRLTRIRQQR
jgi:hypothetical protein